MNIEFADGLNCLIGHRGTGKTTVLEFIRYALDEFPNDGGGQSRKRVDGKLDRLFDQAASGSTSAATGPCTHRPWQGWVKGFFGQYNPAAEKIADFIPPGELLRMVRDGRTEELQTQAELRGNQASKAMEAFTGHLTPWGRFRYVKSAGPALGWPDAASRRTARSPRRGKPPWATSRRLPMQPDDRLLVDGQETARITSLSLRTIERLVSMGRFPRPIRLGRRRLWDRRKLEEWVAAGCPGE